MRYHWHQCVCGRHSCQGEGYSSKNGRQQSDHCDKEREGTNVTLKDGAPVIVVTKGSMSDIKSNTFVGITAMPQPDGTQKAVEVHVFEESLRGAGEGHYPWDLMPNSTMTNGAVAQQVEKVEGNTLQVKYKDGEKTIVVPKDAEVVNLLAGSKADLKTGAHVFIPRWEKQGDGTWQAAAAAAAHTHLKVGELACPVKGKLSCR
jgi:hypothetical protein